MKRLILILCIFLISTYILPAQKSLEAQEKSIAVPVRVFDGDEFLADLKIDDFEIYEDGTKQKIKALYLTEKDQITRKEGLTEMNPDVSRTYYLLFQFTEYNPKIADAIKYFFSDVISQGDSLELMTPMKKYSLSNQALQSMSREELSEEMIKIVRKDTQTGSSQYKNLLRDLRRIVSSISGTSSRTGFEFDQDSSVDAFGIEFLLPRYRETLNEIEQLRIVNQSKYLDFANQLRNIKGQKFMYLFYEREFRPEIHPNVIQQLISNLQDQPHVLGNLQDLMAVYSRESKLDTKTIKRLYTDAGIYFNFIFMDKKPDIYSGIQMHEQSEDVYETFSETAKATGGAVYSTQNPFLSFKESSDQAKQYYLLYYTPEKARNQGEFRNIEVKVKNKDCKLSYRTGYFSK